MVETAVRKSATLIEALPYIKQFRDRIVVIKLGGSAQDDLEVLHRIFTDIDFMLSVGMKPVIVHGGGKRISRAMEEAGLKTEFIHGQRVTDKETIGIASRVLIDEVGSDLQDLIARCGSGAKKLNGRDHGFLRAIKKVIPEQPDADLGYVGEPVAIDPMCVYEALNEGKLPLIAPIACGCGNDTESLYNVNGDTASALIARDLHAEKLVFFCDTQGIYQDIKQPDTLIRHIEKGQVDGLMKAGVIAGGMIPKVQAALFALEGGVRKVHIVAGTQTHALLLEIFTPSGVGTEIVL